MRNGDLTIIICERQWVVNLGMLFPSCRAAGLAQLCRQLGQAVDRHDDEQVRQLATKIKSAFDAICGFINEKLTTFKANILFSTLSPRITTGRKNLSCLDPEV